MSTTALIIGATGAIGKLALPALLSSPTYSRVGEFGRRVTTPAPAAAENKLLQRSIDFEKLSEAGLKDEAWDVVYISLGTTKAIAGSKEAFTKIDKDYVVNAAKEARVPGRKQRLVYLSSAGSNPSSFIFYLKSKGQTEQALAEIGYDDFITLRPGMFLGTDRTGTNREGEAIGKIGEFIGSFFTSAHVDDIVLAFRLAGEKGTEGLPSSVKATSVSSDPKHPHTVISNDGVKALAQSAK